MTTTGKSPDPRGVDHPVHYNTHPSGIEAIDICEHLSFNLGNAVKYLFRVGQKDDPAKDLDKAIWYLDRELTHNSTTMHGRFSEVGTPVRERCYPFSRRLDWDRVIVSEDSEEYRWIWAHIARGDLGEALRIVKEIRGDLPPATT